MPIADRRLPNPTTPEQVRALADQGIYFPSDAAIIADVVIETPAELPGGVATHHIPLAIGAFSYSWSLITPPVRSIGRYCSIAAEIGFGHAEHPTRWLTTSSVLYESNDDWMWGKFARSRGRIHEHPPCAYEDTLPPIVIGNDVWIGYRSYIKAGITIGNGAIIGAHAVVTRDVPPYAVVVGNPGRIIRYRFDEDIIKRLAALQWWNYAFDELPMKGADDVSKVIEDIAAMISRKDVLPYEPVKTCIHA